MGQSVVCVCLVGAFAIAACSSGPAIHTSLDPGANLSSYKTYAFVPQPGTNRDGNSTPLTSYFESAIASEMSSRDYIPAQNAPPDILVNFNTNVRQQADIRATPGFGGYYGYRAGLYSGVEGVETVHYKVGTANIDLVDANKRAVIWEGVAEGELTNKVLKDPQAAVQRVVAAMFMRFPGRAAGQASR